MTAVVATNRVTIIVVGRERRRHDRGSWKPPKCSRTWCWSKPEPRADGFHQLYKYFPKAAVNLHGTGSQSPAPAGNKRIRVLTLAEVAAISGATGDFHRHRQIKPRCVSELHRLRRLRQCPSVAKFPNAFSFFLNKTRFACLPRPMAYRSVRALVLDHRYARRGKSQEPRAKVDIST